MDDLHVRREDRGTDPPRAYAITHTPSPPGVTVLVLRGEVDIAATPELRGLVEAAPAGEELVLDLSGARFLDSAMLRELLRTREQPVRLVLAGLRPPVRRLLDLTRTAELFELAPDVETALRRLG